MKKQTLLLVLGMLCLGQALLAQSPQAIQDYIARYKEAAIQEMQRSGVPAAITLAQGIHETQAGQSDLVLASNNHFGIKCKSDWTGPYVVHDDDAKGEHFRKYDCALDSYKDHSDFLRNSSRYAFLFDLDPADYEGWANGLKKAGYATNPKYPVLLIKLIEDYNLQDYSLVAMGRKSMDAIEYQVGAPVAAMPGVAPTHRTIVPPATSVQPQTTYPEGVFRINETNVVFVPQGTAYLAIAQQHHLSLPRLFEFNDMEPQDIAAADGLIFLQRKRKTGAAEMHKVVPGENLYSIAQTEGIRMENLLEYNFLTPAMQPEIGESLYLHGKAPAMPRLAKVPAQNNDDNAVSMVSTTGIMQQLTNSKKEEDAYVMHIVQPKETMYAIARKYAVRLDDVLKWNDLQTPELKIGQELRINKKTINATY